MSRKLSRLVLVASLAAGFGLAPMVDANAAQSGIDVTQNRFGDGSLDIYVNDTVIWYILDGTHTITPDKDKGAKWDEESSGDLEAGKDFTSAPFPKPGRYHYYCEHHDGMTAYIDVIDPNATPVTTAPPATTTTTAPPTTTTRPPIVSTPTTSAPASATGTHSPSSAGPAPTTTTAPKGDKGDKNKKQKDDPTTTTTEVVPPPPAPVDIPDSAIIPALPGSDQLPTSTEIQQGAIGEPGSAPEGEAIALLKKKRGGNGVKLLIASGLGLGALGLGTAGYKFANRSSKYFPA